MRALRSLTLPAALLALALLLAGCGYGFVSSAPVDLPENVRTLAVTRINNPTQQTWLPAVLSARFRDELTQKHQLSWVDPAVADGLVTLTIDKFFISTELSDARSETLKFNANVTLSASIRRRVDNQVVWQSEKVSYSETYFSANNEEARERAVDLAVRRLADQLGQAY